MRISLHGGDCCGIKHIHGLGYYPDTPLAARKARKMTSFGQHWNGGHNDMIHSNSRGKCDFFNEAAPKESRRERFKRFVEFIKSKRPHGIIETTLNAHGTQWKPIFAELGFKAVSSAKNSNTSSIITVYHLTY